MKRETYTVLVALFLFLGASYGDARPPANTRALKSKAIKVALVGKHISYNPPGWADTAMTEEFHPDHVWRGVLYGIGIIASTGKWSIKGEQICVVADHESFAERWLKGQNCRKLWQDVDSGKLRIAYLSDRPFSPDNFGLQILTVRDLNLSQ